MLLQQHRLRGRIEGCHDQGFQPKSLASLITFNPTPLLPPSLDINVFEFALGDVDVTAEVPLDIINDSFC